MQHVPRNFTGDSLRSYARRTTQIRVRGQRTIGLMDSCRAAVCKYGSNVVAGIGRKYIVPQHASEMVDWYAGHSIAIQFILLALLAAIFLIFRKRVRYIRQK